MKSREDIRPAGMRSGGRKNPMLDDGAGEGNGDGDRGTVKCREPTVWNDDGIMRLQGRKGMDPKGLPPFNSGCGLPRGDEKGRSHRQLGGFTS